MLCACRLTWCPPPPSAKVSAELDEQIARWDALSPEEDMEYAADLLRVAEAQECALHTGDRVLLDRGCAGFCSGIVATVVAAEDYQIAIELDSAMAAARFCFLGHRARTLYKAPCATNLCVGQCVRVAFEYKYDEDTTAHSEASNGLDSQPSRARWYYGKLARIHPKGELVDITYDTGERATRMPMYRIKVCVTVS